MPAIRNRPRVDVVLRVPKARPWSGEVDEAWTATATTIETRDVATATAVEKGKERQDGRGDSGDASSGETGDRLGAAPSAGGSVAPMTTGEGPLSALDLSGPDSSKTDTAAVAKPSAQKQHSPLPLPHKTRPAETSCAEWNSLLIWARRMRGPQWDASIGMWMVDQGSEEHYTFCSDPTQSVHSGGPSLSMHPLPPHIQDHESSGLSSASSTRPPTASAPFYQQQHQHLLAPPASAITPTRPDLQNNDAAFYASNLPPGSAPTSLDSKPQPLLPASQVQHFGQPLGSQQLGRRASPRW